MTFPAGTAAHVNGLPTLDAARFYTRSGRRVVPVGHRQKECFLDNWSGLDLDEVELPDHFPPGRPSNIGMKNGPASRNLVDLDLDKPEAVVAANHFAPYTPWVSGRDSNPRSHRWYTSDPPPATAQFEDIDGKMLVELRSDGTQTVCPPSTHESGERYVWHELKDEPTPVGGTELTAVAARIAAVALLSRHWPNQGSRHKAFNALAGGLLASGKSEDYTEAFILALADATNDEEARKRVKNVATTAKRLANEEKATGWTRLSEILQGDGPKIVERVRGWLGVRVKWGEGAEATQPQPEEWGPVLPFGRDTPPPPFPTDVLPTWLRSFVAAHAAATQTPPCATAMLALAALSGGFGGKVRYLIRNGWFKAANLYVVVAMDPGERKSAVFKAVFAPVHAAEKKAIEQALPVIAEAEAERGTMEARLKHLQGKAAKSDDESERGDLSRQAKELAAQLAEFVVPPRPVFVVDDETLESLGKTLVEQGGRLLQAAAEGTAFEIAGGRYADDENFDVYLKAHDGDYFKTGRVSRGRQSHDGPALSCGLAVQPDVLHCLGRSARAKGRGFLARWLYSVPGPMVGRRQVRPEPVPIAVGDAYVKALSAIWEIPVPAEPTVVPFSPGADNELARFEARVEPRLGPDGDLSGLAAWGTKLAGEAARIAGTLHMAEAAGAGRLAAPGPVTSSAVCAAARLAETYLIPHAVRAFGVMGADPAEALARRVVRWLVRHPKVAQVSRNDAYKALKGGKSDLKADDLAPAFDLLVAHGYLRPAAHGGGPGRRPERYDVNPTWKRSDSHDASPESPETPPTGSGERADDGNPSPESPEMTDDGVAVRTVSGDSGDTRGESGAQTAAPPGPDGGAAESPDPTGTARPMGEYVVVTDLDGLEAVRSGLDDAQGERVYLDTETTGLNPLTDRVRLLSLCVPAGEDLVVYLIDCFRVDPSPLWESLAGCEVVGQNLLFDLQFLSRLGFRPGATTDTMLVAAVETSGTADKVNLAAIAQRYLGWDMNKAEQASDWSGDLTAMQRLYAADDVRVLNPLLTELGRRVESAGLKQAADIECRALPAVAWMSATGVAFDAQKWKERAVAADRAMAEAVAELDGLAPERAEQIFTDSWVWSKAAHIAEALKLVGHPVTDTRDATLAGIDHPLAAALRRYRACEKQVTSYGADWLDYLGPDGRIHAQWRQLGAASGRMACSDPNLQQVPRDDSRKCFVAGPGNVLIKCDYSQIELRIAARITEDAALLAAYRRGDDLHTLTAKAVLGAKEVTRADRQLAKAVNFGLLFGMGAKGFRNYAKAQYGMNLTEDQAQQYRSAFFRAYPGLRAWHERTRQAVERLFRKDPAGTHEVRTLAGRRRLLKVGKKSSQGEMYPNVTEALNTPVQGSGADGLKEALAFLWERRAECPTAAPVLAVHDEIVLEVPEADAPAATDWLKRCMVDAVVPLIDPVPVEVEAKVGRTWGGD